jgi:hypothetical protein
MTRNYPKKSFVKYVQCSNDLRLTCPLVSPYEPLNRNGDYQTADAPIPFEAGLICFRQRQLPLAIALSPKMFTDKRT